MNEGVKQLLYYSKSVINYELFLIFNSHGSVIYLLFSLVLLIRGKKTKTKYDTHFPNFRVNSEENK